MTDASEGFSGVARLSELNELGRITPETFTSVAVDVTVSTVTDEETFYREVISHFPDAQPSARYLVEFWTEDTRCHACAELSNKTEPGMQCLTCDSTGVVQREEWDKRWDRRVITNHPDLLAAWHRGNYTGA